MYFLRKNGAALIEKIRKDILKNKFTKEKKEQINPGAQREKSPDAEKGQGTIVIHFVKNLVFC